MMVGDVCVCVMGEDWIFIEVLLEMELFIFVIRWKVGMKVYLMVEDLEGVVIFLLFSFELG